MSRKFKSATIENKKAYHEYFIDETLECGVELLGNEVKSIRAGRASIKESWIDIASGQMVIKQMHITPWETANMFDVNAKREIRLLAHKKEINRFYNKIKQDGYTLVPLKIYFNEYGRCKVLVGLAKGKKLYDKRDVDKAKQAKRDIERAMKSR